MQTQSTVFDKIEKKNIERFPENTDLACIDKLLTMVQMFLQIIWSSQ